MGIEIDLLAAYPKTKRDPKTRAASKTEEDRFIARQFGKDFFDGDRRHGYGGYNYNPRFWCPVVPDFVRHFGICVGMRILDVGCGKGFMLHDFKTNIPGVDVAGLDISEYAISNAMDGTKDCCIVGNAMNLPFRDHSFDVVISINTVHNLERKDCAQALREIERVGKGRSFITVDAYRNDEDKELMYAWNLTAKTIMSTTEWKDFFTKAGYTGDFYWFMP